MTYHHIFMHLNFCKQQTYAYVLASLFSFYVDKYGHEHTYLYFTFITLRSMEFQFIHTLGELKVPISRKIWLNRQKFGEHDYIISWYEYEMNVLFLFELKVVIAV